MVFSSIDFIFSFPPGIFGDLFSGSIFLQELDFILAGVCASICTGLRVTLCILACFFFPPRLLIWPAEV